MRIGTWTNYDTKVKQEYGEGTKVVHDGTSTVYSLDGKVYRLMVWDKDAIKKKVQFSDGKLTEFEDRTRGDNNLRIAKFGNDGSGLDEWRGKFYHKRESTWRDQLPGVKWVIRRGANGGPYLNDGDFTESATNKDGKVIRVVDFIKGRKHGEEKYFNAQGRQLESKYFFHDTEVPRYIWSQPESITVDELLDEPNTEVRRAMMELMGFEVFLERCRAKGMVEVVDEADPMTGSLLRITVNKEVLERTGSQTSDEELDRAQVMLLRVKDGTLPKHYVLRVPRGMKTAREANAWTWGFEKAEQYAPIAQR